MKQMKTFS